MSGIGEVAMRRAVVAACLVSLVLSGCAAPQTEFVAAGTDREQLMAAIARRGEVITRDDVATTERPTSPQSRLDKSVQFVIETTPIVVGCVLLAPVFVAAMIAKGRAGQGSSPTTST
jgi:hypothetical protein